MAYKNFKKAEIIDEIGSELRKARNAKELTLAQVADNLEQNGTHVSGIMLGRIENGQRRIDDTLLHALCELYHIDSNDLTINACQSHITALQQNKCPANSAETDVNWFLDTYRSLPENRQADIRTMLRLYSYMDKFSNLVSLVILLYQSFHFSLHLFYNFLR